MVITLCPSAIEADAAEVTGGEIVLQETYLSEEIQNYCIYYGEKYGINPYLIEAMIETESGGNKDATNEESGCKGLMQIDERWHQERMEKLGVTDLYDIGSNILVGTDYISELIGRCNNDYGRALMIYHGEKNALTKEEYSNYATKILNRSNELTLLALS